MRTTAVSLWSGSRWGPTRKRKQSSPRAILTVPGGRRWIEEMKRAVALLLLTMSCGPQGSPEQRYRRAVLTLRRGELTQALDASRLEAGRSTPDSQYYWKFRLLEAEVLIYQGN